jgi:hypothetical protein
MDRIVCFSEYSPVFSLGVIVLPHKELSALSGDAQLKKGQSQVLSYTGHYGSHDIAKAPEHMGVDL